VWYQTYKLSSNITERLYIEIIREQKTGETENQTDSGLKTRIKDVLMFLHGFAVIFHHASFKGYGNIN
jgi:esterase/lipase superfamily enzyme